MKAPKARKNYRSRTPKRKGTSVSRKIANRFSLFYTGKPKKPASKLQKKLAAIALKYFNQLQIAITVLIIAYTIFCIFYNFKLILAIPVLSLTVHYWSRLKIIFKYPKLAYWYVKVYLLFRNYYQDRRELYNTKDLLAHFVFQDKNHVYIPVKKSKEYILDNGNKVLIWGESGSVIGSKRNSIEKFNLHRSKEYIKIITAPTPKKSDTPVKNNSQKTIKT